MIAGWFAALILWGAVTLGGRGLLRGSGLITCRFGDWGTAFLAGFSVYGLIVFALLLAGAPYTREVAATVAGLVLAGGLAWGRRRTEPHAATPAWTPAERTLLAAFGCLCVFAFIQSNMFPVSATDALSYDGRARYLAAEHTLNLEIYHWPGIGITRRTNISYPPLMSQALAVPYLFGAAQSKAVMGIFAMAWPLTVFGLLRGHLPRFWALAWTVVLAATPEVFSHSAFALLNVPAMALATAALVALERARRTASRGGYGLAALFAAAGVGVRPDAVVVLGGVCAVWLLRDLWLRNWHPSRALGLAAVALAPLAVLAAWQIYASKVIGLSGELPYLSGNAYGWGPVLHALPALLFSWPTFGAVFFLGLLAVVGRSRSETGWSFLLAWLGMVGVLAAGFASLDRSYGGPVIDLMTSSFKRSLFYAVPAAGIAAALSPWGLALARRGRGVLTLDAKDPA